VTTTERAAEAMRQIAQWHPQKPEPLACYDCLLPYGGPGWCDAHVPDDVWAQIAPTEQGGGVLCITCMARRIEALVLDDVPIVIGSGPWVHAPEVARLDGLTMGRKQVLAEFRREAQHADRVGNTEEQMLLLDIADHVERTLG
jgi:hypothetical protein